MEDLFYIKGNDRRYKEVEERLLEQYPYAKGQSLFLFNRENVIYTIDDGEICCYDASSFTGKLIIKYGTELKLEDK